ncbi:hypothetical protein VI08_09500 [Luteibacter yeojuensis]|uniref:Uncharacterized protein n=1 Tax=Luteibacter yeojuensis TaxID=345309 RepID=A0A0F3KUG0_9GAMM|nr:hypothetical protein VI08_09500 [Luteibacter yeojuensis]
MEVTLASLRATLGRLDGKVHTMAVLGGVGEDWPKLTIGGGGGTYIVMYTRNGPDAGWWDLVSDGKPDATRSLVVGGQEGDYPLNLLNGSDATFRAAAHFFETGEMSAGLTWQKG